METTEEILNKLIERIEWHKRQAAACEDERSFWAERGRLELADGWKRNADEHRKALKEIEKRLEAANQGPKEGEAMGNKKPSPPEARDVLTLIGLLRELTKEDSKILAAITCDEAELTEGGTGLPTVRALAHELIDLAERALEALGGE